MSQHRNSVSNKNPLFQTPNNLAKLFSTLENASHGDLVEWWSGWERGWGCFRELSKERGVRVRHRSKGMLRVLFLRKKIINYFGSCP